MRTPYIIATVFISFLVLGCTGSKNYSRKAKKLQEVGLNDEAANFYYESLVRNEKNVNAKIGLKTTGQIQIENTLTAFYKAYSVANYKDAVYKYQEALKYQSDYGQYVSMEIPPYYNDYYQEMLVVYLVERYQVAGDLLYDENFADAQRIYSEILNLDPDYQDAKELNLEAIVEPLYRKGVVAYKMKKYRSCYALMNQVLAKKAMYKDAIDYKERALEDGQVIIAVLEFQSNVPLKRNIIKSIQADVVSGIINNNDPFIKVIDRSNMETLIREQKINVNESTYGNSAIKAGELLGADMLIHGKLLNYTYSGGRVKNYVMQGFESFRVKKMDPKTKKPYYETRYKRVNYVEYIGSSSFYGEVQYQLISAETGEVVNSNVFKGSRSDNLNYVTYKGNYKNLYAGKYRGSGSLYKSGDVIYNSYSQKKSLNRKVTSSKRHLLSEQSMATVVFEDITSKIVNSIIRYNTDEL